MNIKNKTFVFLTFLSVFILNACSHHAKNDFRKTAEEYHLVNYVAVNDKGQKIVLDRTGKMVPECKPQNTDYPYDKTNSNVKPCNTRVEKRNGKTIIIRNGKQVDLLSEEHIWFYNYPGSDCITTIDSNGNQTDDCW